MLMGAQGLQKWIETKESNPSINIIKERLNSTILSIKGIETTKRFLYESLHTLFHNTFSFASIIVHI